MKIVVTHPTGNRNVRAVMSAFDQAGVLAFFGTTLGVDPDHYLLKLLPANIAKDLARRSYPLSSGLIRTRPLLELLRNVLPKFGFKNAVAHETGFASVDKIYQDLDKATASLLKRENKMQKIDAVYCYEDGAVDTFVAAKKLGMECIYDLPIGYWRSARILLSAEKERWPEWASTLTGFRDSQQKLDRKDEELRLAERIYVASSFTAKTLADYPSKLAPVEVIPYGFPPVVESRSYPPLQNRALKLLFVGGLSQRKGIADLFAAVKNIGNGVELTVVGKKMNVDCPALDKALKEHHYIPTLAHNEILEIMREHDVFVFPSLFEGFGLVITEAMSQGTPVITTDRTAGPDLITHGLDGWIIEAGSTDALQKQIEELLAKPETVAAAGKAAMERAKLRPWEKYGEELTASITRNK